MTDVEFLRSVALGMSNVPPGYGFSGADVPRLRDIAERMSKLVDAAQKVASQWAGGDDLEALTPHIETLECSLWAAGVDTR